MTDNDLLSMNRFRGIRVVEPRTFLIEFPRHSRDSKSLPAAAVDALLIRPVLLLIFRGRSGAAAGREAALVVAGRFAGVRRAAGAQTQAAQRIFRFAFRFVIRIGPFGVAQPLFLTLNELLGLGATSPIDSTVPGHPCRSSWRSSNNRAPTRSLFWRNSNSDRRVWSAGPRGANRNRLREFHRENRRRRAMFPWGALDNRSDSAGRAVAVLRWLDRSFSCRRWVADLWPNRSCGWPSRCLCRCPIDRCGRPISDRCPACSKRRLCQVRSICRPLHRPAVFLPGISLPG